MCSTLPLPLCRGSWDLSGYQKSLASLPRTPWIGYSQMYVGVYTWTERVFKKQKKQKTNTGEVTVQTAIWQCLSLVQLTVFLIFFPTVADDVNCTLCDSPGDLLDQLFCTSCGQHYHGICLDMAVTPLRRAGWQCPECKICQTCKWVSFPPT